MMFFMVFMATETADGLIHIQNYVGGLKGQHHVHSKEGFEKWLKISKTKRSNVDLHKGNCQCCLKAGDVREYDGREWHSERF